MLKKIKNKLLNKWIILIVLVAAGGLYWWYQQQQKNSQEYEFVTATEGELVEYLEVSGVVDASMKARLRFPAGGKIVYIGAQEGEKIVPGQTIASIDRQTLEKQLSQDLNKYMQERWSYEQTYDDFENQVRTDEVKREIDDAQWSLDNKVIDVEIRSIAIADSRLSAPFGGVLTVSPVKTTGVAISATDYFELINPDTLQIVSLIDEVDIAKLKPGMKATIGLDAYPDEEIQTDLRYISFVSSQSSSGTVFRVEMDLDSTNIEKYRLGMNADVSIEIDRNPNAIYLPFEAVNYDPDTGEAYVMIDSESEGLTRRNVVTGLETDDDIEIVSGVTLSDKVAIKR